MRDRLERLLKKHAIARKFKGGKEKKGKSGNEVIPKRRRNKGLKSIKGPRYMSQIWETCAKPFYTK